MSAPGTLITTCTVPGTIALTFDDGPSIYTPQLLDILARYGVKATFFIIGGGDRGHIDDWSQPWPSILERMHSEGHQLASHTWTHADLSTLTWDGMDAEIMNNENAFMNVFGFAPTYLRPPYLSCNDGCMQILASLGYHVISIDIDTKDYENQQSLWVSQQNFENGLSAGGNLVLSHDIYEQTVVTLAPYMLETLLARGLRPVTVGQCLGDAGASWYRGPR
ncbi:chitin deacetylase [Diplocarpon rosae]|nr:chitin deacetylase [Diplocarpon rosae]